MTTEADDEPIPLPDDLPGDEADMPRMSAKTELARYSRSQMKFQVALAAVMVVLGAAVIVAAIFSLMGQASAPRQANEGSQTVFIALLGVFVSLAGSAFFSGAAGTKKRILEAERLIRAGRSDAEAAAALRLRPETIAMVRAAMPAERTGATR